jgi:carboxymethylenebutenolidase
MGDLDGCGGHRDLPTIVAADEARRAFLKGLASLPLAAILFDPLLARAQADRTQMTEIVTGDGKTVRGALALPPAEKAPAILLVHEWWGLDDEVKTMAAEFAAQGFVAFAIDLFDQDRTTDPETAMKLVQGLDPAVATEKLQTALGWLESHERGTGRIGTIGWGFGGGWSLNASLARPVDATVVYYGNVDKTAAELKSLHGPVLGHFATQDQNITREMVERFEKAMQEAGKGNLLQVYWYDADQAFANPAGGRYDADDARLAWDRTLEFLKTRLAG